MRTVAKKDQALFTEFKTLQFEITDRKRKQDTLVARINGLANRQETQTHELAQVREEKGEILEGLRAKAGELKAMIEQLKPTKEIGSQIAAFSAHARPGRGRGMVQLPAFTGRISAPVEGARISDGFGMRYHPILHRYRMRYGMDFAAAARNPISRRGESDR